MSGVCLSSEASAAAIDYRYQRFTTRLLFRDLRFRRNSAKPGDSIPEFEILTTEEKILTHRNISGDRPVLYIFGSLTCPMTASAAPSVQALYEEFGDRVRFVMLYVREAHPGERVPQAATIGEKLDHARKLKKHYDITWTVAADTIDGELHRALDPKPNSAFLADQNGVILFRSLWAADGKALHQALDAATSGRTSDRKQSTAMIGPVSRAMGSVNEVMKRGGPQAVSDLWKAGLPMALAGLVATYLPFRSADQRGIVAVLALLLSMAAVVLTFATWMDS